MNCTACEGLFDAYLDEELAGSLQLEFDAHRLRCRRCQQSLAMMETVAHVIETDSQVPALSFDFTDRVLDTVEKRRPWSRRLRSTRVAVAAGFVIQAAAVLVFAIMFPSEEVDEPSTARPVVLTIDAGPPPDFEDMDRIDLYEHIYSRVELLQTAGANWGADLGHLARYAQSFNVTDEVARNSERLANSSPWSGLLPVPAAPEESEPSLASANDFSL